MTIATNSLLELCSKFVEFILISQFSKIETERRQQQYCAWHSMACVIKTQDYLHLVQNSDYWCKQDHQAQDRCTGSPESSERNTTISTI